MSHIELELQRLGRALWVDPRPAREAEFYAAQQALAWAMNPEDSMSPFDYITQA